MDNSTASYLINGTGSSTTYNYDYDPDDLADYGVCQYERHGSYFLPVLYYIFFIVGLLGNMLVLWVIAFGVRLCSMSDVCLLNLAIADLLLVCSLPFLAHQAWDQWLFGDAMCKVVMGAYHVGFYCGIFFILLMSVDRYLAIVSAVHVLRARTRFFGLIAAAITWVAGLLASFPDLAFLQVQEASSRSGPYCAPRYSSAAEDGTTTHNRHHFWSVFGLFKMNVLGLLIPMTVMVFCYAQIIRTLQYSPSAKRQSIRLVLVVVAVFFCCWMPYNIASLFKALELLDVYTGCESSKAIRLALQLTEVMAYSHSCLNPVLYVFVGQKFRGHLVKLMNRVPCRLCQLMGNLVSQNKVTVSAYSVSAYSQTPSVDEKSTAL